MKWFTLALVACHLNLYYNVQVTVLLLTTVLFTRGPWIFKNWIAARRAAKTEMTKEERDKLLRDESSSTDLDLVSEERLAQVLISIYLLMNNFLEMVREIIQF